MGINRTIVRKAYREAIIEVFGCGDKKLDAHLTKAAKRDIYLSDKAPGQWSPNSVLEIYTENGIPNACDVIQTEYGTYFACEKWQKIDEVVNQKLEPHGVKCWHEPYSYSVVTVNWL